MAKVLLIWAAVISVQLVLISAKDCSEVEKITNCNECIRCGGHWCNDQKEAYQCSKVISDTWCTKHKEKVVTEEVIEEVGKHLSTKYSERTVLVGNANIFTINYKSPSQPTVEVRIVNTTQNNEFITMHDTNCDNGQCKTVVEAMPSNSFCSQTGRTSEYVNVKVKIGSLSEEAIVKYRVPCACGCADKTEKYSKLCNENGDFSCGNCHCYDGWTGKNCETQICGAKRGDVPCNHPRNNMECSGNGVCGPCETCICFNDRYGSQYFDKHDYCADICLTTSECEECLQNPTLGKCAFCPFPFIYREFNASLVEERDDRNRSVWIKCNLTFTITSSYEYVEYFTMRDERRDIYFMIPPSDISNAAIGGGGVSVTLPIVLGVIAFAATAVAVAGYIMWKNRVPPVPLADPMYTNIDAEDSTGENPLYKPPTSSFKNPTYGKW